MFFHVLKVNDFFYIRSNWLNYGPSYIRFIFEQQSNVQQDSNILKISTSWFKMWKRNQDSSMEFENFYPV